MKSIVLFWVFLKSFSCLDDGIEEIISTKIKMKILKFNQTAYSENRILEV